MFIHEKHLRGSSRSKQRQLLVRGKGDWGKKSCYYVQYVHANVFWIAWSVHWIHSVKFS